ncbi:type II secretion system F family protein [Altererythrobacter aquiaggeris]|uniref:type II secretion system F family protein n=1 Tax=Aestuarierythrobacter aquiaggeris TaxID=1898396 RepID=UPI0030159FC2
MTGDAVRVLVLLAIFGAVFLLVQIILRYSVANRVHVGAVNARLKLIAKGADRDEIISNLRKNDPLAGVGGGGVFAGLYTAFRRNLMMSALPYTPFQAALGMAVLFITLFLVIAISAWTSNYPLTGGVIQLIMAVSASVAIAVPLLAASFLAQRRRKKMQEQFPVALDIFVRALRSGHPIASAIDLLTGEMEDPIGSEFGLIADEVSYGAELTDALNDMAERWELDDIRMFVVSLSVQSETGGNLAEILDNLSKVIRERAGLYLKVRALSSEGRMTGWLLTGLPIFTFVSLFAMNPAFYLGVAMDPIFYIGFPLLLVWYLVGVIAIKRMVNLQV